MNQAPNVPPPVSGGQNPYDFINSPQQPKTPLGSGLSKQKRILLVVGGGILLLILVGIISSFISSLGSGIKKDILLARQQQTEIIRISEIGMKTATSDATRNLAITTNLTMVSDSAKLSALADKADVKADGETLSLSQDAQTDTLLETARQNNQFDQKFTEVLIVLLSDYQDSLQRIHAQAENETTKQTLSDIYDSAEILLDEALPESATRPSE